MSIRRWTCGAVSAASLIAVTAYADPGAAPAPEAKPKPAASAAPQATSPQLRRAGAAAAAEGKQGGRPQAPGAQGAATAEGARVEHGGHGKAEAAHDHDGHHDEAEGHGHSGAPPRAAIEALMKARSLTEAQAIEHLRGGREVAGADVAVADVAEARRTEMRRERAKELRGRLKSRGIPNQLRAELRTHAKRLAQIERIRGLVGADAKLTVRIDAMLVRENERHTRRMTRLIDEANQAPAEAAPSEAAPMPEAPAGSAPAGSAPAGSAPAGDAPKAPEQGVTP